MLLIGNISKKKLIIADNKIRFELSNFLIKLKFLKVKIKNKKPIVNKINSPTIPELVKVSK